MTMSRRDDPEGRGKALDLWQPPNGAGEPRFCVATTFTFHADFFEVECLGRFLQMDTHPQETDSVAYLIEREEKLSGARVCVLVDRRHATAKESLRWDVLPVVVPHAVQHAKLALLVWANRVRVVIGSGNLTKEGYRENLEVFGCLETAREQAGHHAAVLESITFLERVADRALGDEGGPGPRQRLRDTLAAARTLVQGWPPEERGRARVAPIFGGVGPSIFDQLRECWPPGGPPRHARVVSPFFDPDPRAAAVVPALVDVLAKRGDRSCRFYISAEPQADGRTRLFAPRGLIDAAREHTSTFAHGLPLEQGGEPRRLHAKMLALANDEWQLLLIGSSNFTRAGLGIAAGAANLEANLAYVTRTDDPDFRALECVWPDVGDEVDLDSPAIVWDPVFNGDSGEVGPPPLPAAFREALFDGGATPPALVLSLGEHLPPRWAIETTDGKGVLRSETWSGQTRDVRVVWACRPPVVLRVTWGEESHTADWPVNVVDLSTLPPPDVLRDLTLEELLDVLASTRPLHQAVVEVLVKRGRRKTPDVEPDPHKRVNTATFLLQRTKRVALALERLRERLERPIGSVEALDWRLLGPIGPRALAEAFRRDARSPDEARFFLAELALALKRVRVEEGARGGLEASLIRERLDARLAELEARAATMQGGSGLAMDRYITGAFAEARRR
jgi:hypothetical protein